MTVSDWLAVFSGTPKEETEKDARGESGAIKRPTSADPDWDVKIRRARKAWEAGRRLRKTQPASPASLFAP